MTLKGQLIADEGWKSTPYQDTLGIWTVGVGFNLQDDIPDAVINYWLDHIISQRKEELRKTFNFYETLDKVRQDVLVNMAYNLGIPRLKTFKKMIRALNVGNYTKASMEMLDSKWAKQVGTRAKRLADEMKYGKRGGLQNAKRI